MIAAGAEIWAGPFGSLAHVWAVRFDMEIWFVGVHSAWDGMDIERRLGPFHFYEVDRRCFGVFFGHALGGWVDGSLDTLELFACSGAE